MLSCFPKLFKKRPRFEDAEPDDKEEEIETLEEQEVIRSRMEQEMTAIDELMEKADLNKDETAMVNKVRVSIQRYANLSLANMRPKGRFEELESFVHDIKYQHIYRSYSGKYSSMSLMLSGPEGCGKTMAWCCTLGEVARAENKGELPLPVIAMEVDSTSCKYEYLDRHEYITLVNYGLLINYT